MYAFMAVNCYACTAIDTGLFMQGKVGATLYVLLCMHGYVYKAMFSYVFMTIYGYA